jgi:DNA sulfur modification protein DndB
VKASFGYNFPAIRGIQAGREYFVSMCPLRLIPKIFLFDEEELVPELRAQRTLNRGRLPEMTSYVLENPDDYVFSALTASIDGPVSFQPLADSEETKKLGVLQVAMDARFIINDGQHRRAAIEQVVANRPELGDETIAVVFFVDKGLERCQQMFADLNRHAVRVSRSLGVLYDQRDDSAELARRVVFKSPLFRNIVETERSTLSPRSRKLFTLSAVHHATTALVRGLQREDLDGRTALAIEYWETLAEQFPEWSAVQSREIHSGDVRRDYLHSHGVMLQVFGLIGNHLLREHPNAWKAKLRPLSRIDWSRSNSEVWEGRVLSGGRVSKAGNNVLLTACYLKQQLGLPLDPEEQRIEALAFQHKK